MDLEQLTKHQIVLLTLLVSFVTSIATGIVTVSLMNQAPPEVTRNITQVVQQTVEKVVPVTNNQSAAAATSVQKTVVIKSDDLAVQSIAAAQRSVIRIVGKGDDKLVARGVILTKSGQALTDRDALMSSDATSFEAILASGERVPLSFHSASSTPGGAALVTLQLGTSTGYAPASLADISGLGLGQSVIRIGGVGTDQVAEGVIASLPSQEKDAPARVEATVSSMTPGSVLLTIFGDVIGISTSGSESQSADIYDLPMVGNAGTTTPATKSSS